MVTTVQSNLPKPAAHGLFALTQLLRAELEICNRLIVARMDSPIALIPQLAGHIVAGENNERDARLRPLLTLACARMCGYADADRPLRAAHLAACVDFIHAATLLHDDVADLGPEDAPASAGLGNKAAVLIGDFLFSRAFKLMVEDGSLEVLAILARAAATIAEGEVLQLAIETDQAVSEARYLAMIEAKTAALYGAACQVGGVIARRPAEDIAALGVFGIQLGLAVQLSEDARRAVEQCADSDVRLTLPRLLGGADAVLRTRARASEFAQAACAALSGFAVSPYRDALQDVAAHYGNVRI